MLNEPRPYRDLSDFQRMQGLLREGRRANTHTYYVHPGDVVWWLYYPDQSASFSDRIFLWDSPVGLDGWCLLTPAELCLDVFVHPRWLGTATAEAMFTWAEARLVPQVQATGGKTISTMWIQANDDWRIQGLLQRGYTQQHADPLFTRSLTDSLPAPDLPEGFHIRPTTGEAEAPERARASYGAFESTWEWDRYLQRRLSLMRSPFYPREQDCVVAAPGERIASFCIFWLDAINRVGHFEPVGTHPDFQRRGLGRALLLDCLRRQQQLGMTEATVCTNEDNLAACRLYEAAGFNVTQRLGQFVRPV